MLSIICGRDTKIEAYFSLIIALGPLSRVKENILAAAAAAEFPDVERRACPRRSHRPKTCTICCNGSKQDLSVCPLSCNFGENKINF